MTISVTGPALTFAEVATDPTTGRLVIPVTILRGAPACIQKLRQRLRFWKGEYFLDTRLGVPWRERILRKNPDLNLVNAILRRVIYETPGVRSVDSFQSTLGKDRALSVNFGATLKDGSTVIAQAEPLIIV